MIGFYSCISNSTYKVYLIPDGYEGPLLIMEGVDSVENVNTVGDTSIFDFRKSVVLKFKGKFIEGSNSLSHIKYFYVNKDNVRQEVLYALGNVSKVDSSKPYIYFKYTQVGSNSQCDLISTPKNFKHALNIQQKLCDSLLSKHP
jgi:hypothetical protein